MDKKHSNNCKYPGNKRCLHQGSNKHNRYSWFPGNRNNLLIPYQRKFTASGRNFSQPNIQITSRIPHASSPICHNILIISRRQTIILHFPIDPVHIGTKAYLWSFFSFDRKSGKQFPETYQINRDISSCNNQSYSENNHQHTTPQP